MSNEFRKSRDVWHWCPECPEWPTGEFESAVLSAGVPSGERCPRCKELNEKRECTRQE